MSDDEKNILIQDILERSLHKAICNVYSTIDEYNLISTNDSKLVRDIVDSVCNELSRYIKLAMQYDYKDLR